MTPIPVLIDAFAPHKTISLALEPDASVADVQARLAHICPIPSQSLSTLSGRALLSQAAIGTLRQDQHAVCLRLCAKLPGGKGGFGSQLRAAGGRMASRGGRNAPNNDSCRDLNGRRLSSVKEAQQLAQYVEAAPEREKAAKEAARQKLEALQKEIAKMDNQIAENEAGTSSLGKRKAGQAQEEFVEANKESVETVKSAVAAAMLKKRKKNAAKATPLVDAKMAESAAKAPTASTSVKATA